MQMWLEAERFCHLIMDCYVKQRQLRFSSSTYYMSYKAWSIIWSPLCLKDKTNTTWKKQDWKLQFNMVVQRWYCYLKIQIQICIHESKGSSDKSFSTILALKQFQECDLLSLLQKNKTLISSTKNLICWDLNSSKLWDLNSHLLDTKIQKWGTADATFQINNLNTPEARYHRQQTCDQYLLWNLWHWELEMWWPYHSWNCEMWSVSHD